jgi:fatty acid/phospholipid biosynthesis enzyme
MKYVVVRCQGDVDVRAIRNTIEDAMRWMINECIDQIENDYPNYTEEELFEEIRTSWYFYEMQIFAVEDVE